jgi:hypothetical protein
MRPIGPSYHRRSQEGKGGCGAAIVSLACAARSEMQSGDLVARSSMSDLHSFLSVDSYFRSQAAERMLNTAITQARISESFEEYLEIFDKFYADEVEVSSETQHEPIHGKARVGSLLLNFLVPLHVMAELGGLAISIKETTISGDAANEIHSAWTLNIIGVSGKICTLNWRTLRKWSASRVVYEHHYDQQRRGEPLTFDDLGLDTIEPVAGFQGGQG